MQTGTHISDVLNHQLHVIGSQLILDSDYNQIGEQIAFRTIENRYVEIIRLDNETKAWISFQDQGVSLGSTLSDDLNNMVKTIHAFLEDKVELKTFYDHLLDIKAPIDISKLDGDEQILRELIWFYFLEPTMYANYEPKEWHIMRQFTRSIHLLAKKKRLLPYRSHNRLCFSDTIELSAINVPYLFVSLKENGTKEFTIADHNKNTALKSGTETDIITAFKKLLETLPSVA